MKKFILAICATTIFSSVVMAGPEPKDSFWAKLDSLSKELAKEKAKTDVMNGRIQTLERGLKKNTENDKSWQNSMLISLNGKSDEAKSYTDEMFNKAVVQNTGTEEQLTTAIKKQEVRIDSLASWQKTVNDFITKKQNQIGKPLFFTVTVMSILALLLSLLAIWMAWNKKRREPKSIIEPNPKFKTAPYGDNKGQPAGPQTLV